VNDLRILMVLDSMASGGTETYVLSVAREMKRLGADVIVAGGEGSHAPIFREEFPVHLLPFDWNFKLEEERISRLASVMRDENINIVHMHQTPSGRIALQAARMMGIPVVFTMHGTYYPKSDLLPIVKQCDAVISVSKPVEAFWLREGVASSVIPNGIDLEEFHQAGDREVLREPFGIPKEAMVLLYASRLAWEKADVCKIVLRSAADLKRSEFPQLVVVVAGDGPEMDAIRRLAQQLEYRNHVRFIHLIGQRSNMADCYRMSDIVVGTGRVALEAMACGKPVLALGTCGFLGWVEPSMYEEAWRCYFGDHQSLRSCNQPLLTQTLRKGLSRQELLHWYGEMGRAWVSDLFDITKVTRAIAGVYRDILRV